MSEPQRDIPAITFPPPHGGDGTVNPDVRHERSDVDTRAVLWFVAALAVGIIVVLLLLWWLFVSLTKTENAEKKSNSPLAEQQRALPPADRMPPDPRLEGISAKGLERPAGRIYPPDLDAEHDLGRIRASSATVLARKQEAELNAYGWVDKDRTVAHIPIDQAMRRVLDKLKARKDAKTGEGKP